MKKIHENIPHRTLKIKKDCRDRIDLLRIRASMLTGKDKLLMTMHLRNIICFRLRAGGGGLNVLRIALIKNK